jgi:hypothetical protein
MFNLKFVITRHMIIGLAARLARLAYGRRLDAESDAR